jgi:hypothetical protein
LNKSVKNLTKRLEAGGFRLEALGWRLDGMILKSSQHCPKRFPEGEKHE